MTSRFAGSTLMQLNVVCRRRVPACILHTTETLVCVLCFYFSNLKYRITDRHENMVRYLQVCIRLGVRFFTVKGGVIG